MTITLNGTTGITSPTEIIATSVTVPTISVQTINAGTGNTLSLQTNNVTAVTIDTSQNATFAGKVASASSLQLATNGTTTAVTIDTNQNVGVGVTPSAWATYKAMEVGGAALSLMGGTSGTIFGSVGVNWYFDGTNRIYKNTAAATYYNQSNGVHAWYNAPSGTAGNAITFNQAMTLDTSGNLLVGNTTSPIANGSTTTKTLLVNNTILTGTQFGPSGPFGIITSTSGTVNQNATLSLNLWYFNGSSNTGAVAGHLYVNIVNASYYAAGYMDVWAVTSRSSGSGSSTFTKIQSTSGSNAGTSYTLAWNGSGQIVLTNTYGGFSYCFVAISFVGVTGILE